MSNEIPNSMFVWFGARGTLNAKNDIFNGELKNNQKYVYLPLKEGEGHNYEKIRGYSCSLVDYYNWIVL